MATYTETITENMYVGEDVSYNRLFTLMADEGVLISDSPQLLRIMTAHDSIQMASYAMSSATYLESVAEIVGLTDSILAKKTIIVVVEDALNIASQVSSHAQFLEKIADKVGITTYLTSFDSQGVYNDYDTWVVNYETQAVSKYQNYYFQSMAKIGDKYYGANENGFYLLEGDEDDTNLFIEASITTGYMDLSERGVKSNAQEMFLYVKNNGSLGLKARTEDGWFYDYQLSRENDSIQGSRVLLGKGKRAVYWQFQLTNDNATDFTLDDMKVYRLITSRIT